MSGEDGPLSDDSLTHSRAVSLFGGVPSGGEPLSWGKVTAKYDTRRPHHPTLSHDQLVKKAHHAKVAAPDSLFWFYFFLSLPAQTAPAWTATAEMSARSVCEDRVRLSITRGKTRVGGGECLVFAHGHRGSKAPWVG